MCSCVECLLENFLECSVEPGKLYSGEEGSDDDYYCDMEYEDEDAFGDSIDENMEKYELQSDSVLEVLSEGNFIALFFCIKLSGIVLSLQSNQLWCSS